MFQLDFSCIPVGFQLELCPSPSPLLFLLLFRQPPSAGLNLTHGHSFARQSQLPRRRNGQIVPESWLPPSPGLHSSLTCPRSLHTWSQPLQTLLRQPPDRAKRGRGLEASLAMCQNCLRAKPSASKQWSKTRRSNRTH